MISVADTLTKITDRLQLSATTKTVYGDPVSAEGRTLVPVARVRYGFGAGGGANSGDGGGEGSGGGVEVTPIGLVEITEFGDPIHILGKPAYLHQIRPYCHGNHRSRNGTAETEAMSGTITL